MPDRTANQSCPHCHANYQIGPAHFGRRVKCAKCGQEFRASPPPPPPPIAPTLQPVDESPRFDFRTDLPPRKPRAVKKTRAQNINAAIVIATVAIFGLLLLGVIAGSGDRSRSHDGANPIVTLIFGPILVVALGLAYFAPSMIAYSRDHNNTMPIAIINTVFGWTLLGWVACLAWSLSSDIKQSRVYIKKVIVRADADDDDLDFD